MTALAACLQAASPELFTRDRYDRAAYATATAYCVRCPIVAECLTAGIADRATGIYGGRVLALGRINRTPPPHAPARDDRGVCATCGRYGIGSYARYCEPCRTSVRRDTWTRSKAKRRGAA